MRIEISLKQPKKKQKSEKEANKANNMIMIQQTNDGNITEC